MNSICPGVVKTPLLTENPDLMAHFPSETLIPIERVTEIVMLLISGSEMEDTQGRRVGADEMHSRAVHITGHGFYFTEMPDLHDGSAKNTWNKMMGG